MRERLLLVVMQLFCLLLVPAIARAQQALAGAQFRIKYMAQDAVYLEGGSTNGLKEGQTLIVERPVAPAVVDANLPTPPAPSGIVATLRVLSVTATSTVCEIVSSSEPLVIGDLAHFSAETHHVQWSRSRYRGRAGFDPETSHARCEPGPGTYRNGIQHYD
jgi:hypothetical protein